MTHQVQNGIIVGLLYPQNLVVEQQGQELFQIATPVDPGMTTTRFVEFVVDTTAGQSLRESSWTVSNNRVILARSNIEQLCQFVCLGGIVKLFSSDLPGSL